jgi:hypothetical protein
LPTHSIPTPTASDHIERRSTSTETLNFATNKSVSLDRFAKMWPTPTAGDAKASGSRNTPTSNAHSGISLTDYVKQDGGTGRLWPTPTGRDWKDGSAQACSNVPPNALLGRVVHMYPTPTAPGKHQVGLMAEWGGRGNPFRTPEEMTLAGGSLNPVWVEWLMGFPLGWTACAPSATPSSRKSRKSSDGQS